MFKQQGSRLIARLSSERWMSRTRYTMTFSKIRTFQLLTWLWILKAEHETWNLKPERTKTTSTASLYTSVPSVFEWYWSMTSFGDDYTTLSRTFLSGAKSSLETDRGICFRVSPLFRCSDEFIVIHHFPSQLHDQQPWPQEHANAIRWRRNAPSLKPITEKIHVAVLFWPILLSATTVRSKMTRHTQLRISAKHR